MMTTRVSVRPVGMADVSSLRALRERVKAREAWRLGDDRAVRSEGRGDARARGTRRESGWTDE